MTSRVLRDPMTLEEERRAVLNLQEPTAHCRAIRDMTSPGMLHLHRHHRTDGQGNDDLLPTYAGAILDNDGGRDR